MIPLECREHAVGNIFATGGVNHFAAQLLKRQNRSKAAAAEPIDGKVDVADAVWIDQVIVGTLLPCLLERRREIDGAARQELLSLDQQDHWLGNLGNNLLVELLERRERSHRKRIRPNSHGHVSAIRTTPKVGIGKDTQKILLRDFGRTKFQIDTVNSRKGVEVRAQLHSRQFQQLGVPKEF